MASQDNRDKRPVLAIGHIGPHVVDDLATATAFYTRLGCRLVAGLETLTVLEVRGGTHLVLRAGEASAGERASFDLMVDDIDAAYEDRPGRLGSGDYQQPCGPV